MVAGMSWQAYFESMEKGDQPGCDGCPFQDKYTQQHPHGDGFAEESIVECTARKWEDCEIDQAMDVED